MSFLVCNIPPIQTYVRKEYLYDMEKGFGEFTPAIWVTAKSIHMRALYIEAYLPEYNALYDKLPISAYVNNPHVIKDIPLMPLEELEVWDCPSYHITCVTKEILKSMKVMYRTPRNENLYGEYLFTLDFANPENLVNYSETPAEHKSMNVIALDNGNYALSPNNRMFWYDKSLSNPKQVIPDFRYSTRYFKVENKIDLKDTLGNSDKWDYSEEV
jgi:hypothetical protein